MPGKLLSPENQRIKTKSQPVTSKAKIAAGGDIMHDLVISWGAFSAHIPPWVLYLASLPGFGLMHSKGRRARKGAFPPATRTTHPALTTQQSEELGACFISSQPKTTPLGTSDPNL
jgi:hypothetical protein